MTTGRKHILIAWEVGDNYGHAAEIAQLLPHIGNDIQITAAVRNPVTFRAIVTDPRVEVIAAPHAPYSEPVSDEDFGLNYSDVLRFVGWGDPDTLAAYFESWETLIRLVRPDVVAAQAAPTALLVARALQIPRASMGAGYNSPPRAVPMPPFRHWEPVDAAKLAEREARVVAVANAVLARRGYAKLDAFRDVLDVDRFILSTLPELDHYGRRAGFEPDHPPYFGPIVETHFGAEESWRADADFRILAYLRPGNQSFEPALRALISLPDGVDIIVAAPGAPKQVIERLAETPARLVAGPVAFASLLDDCDLGIGHASPGLAANFALAGVPQIGMPNHTEQMMMAHALSQSNLGLGIVGRPKPEHVLQAIEAVRGSEKVAVATKALAKRWTKADAAQTSPRAADEIMGLL